MNIVRKPESQRGPQLARSAKATAPGIRMPRRRPRRGGLRRAGISTSVALAGAGVDPRRAAGSPRRWRARTPRTRSAATTPARHRRQRRRSAPRRAAPTMPASEMRALALTRVRPSGSRRGTAAARVTPYALDATSTPSAAGNSQRRLGRDRGRQHPAQERADRHRRADRPAAAVAEPVEERPDQRRHDRERQHRQAQEQRDLAAGLAGRHLEEQGAGQRDRHGGVAGGVEGVQLDQPGQPERVRALGARGARRACRTVYRPARPVPRATPATAAAGASALPCRARARPSWPSRRARAVAAASARRPSGGHGRGSILPRPGPTVTGDDRRCVDLTDARP